MGNVNHSNSSRTLLRRFWFQRVLNLLQPSSPPGHSPPPIATLPQLHPKMQSFFQSLEEIPVLETKEFVIHSSGEIVASCDFVVIDQQPVEIINIVAHAALCRKLIPENEGEYLIRSEIFIVIDLNAVHLHRAFVYEAHFKIRWLNPG